MRTCSSGGTALLASLVLADAPAQARDASDYSTQEVVEALVQHFPRSDSALDG